MIEKNWRVSDTISPILRSGRKGKGLRSQIRASLSSRGRVTAVKRTAQLRMRPRRQKVKTPKKNPSSLIGSHGNRGGPEVKKI
jgi:hypothetical protein